MQCSIWGVNSLSWSCAAVPACISGCRVFMTVVEERKHLPALKQFLKLYSVSTWTWPPGSASATACACPVGTHLVNHLTRRVQHMLAGCTSRRIPRSWPVLDAEHPAEQAGKPC